MLHLALALVLLLLAGLLSGQELLVSVAALGGLGGGLEFVDRVAIPIVGH